MWSFNYTNFGNPAAWSRQVLVRAAAGMRFDGIETTDTKDNGKRLLSGTLSAVQFGVPLRSNYLGFGASFEPYSRVNYVILTEDSLATDPRANGQTRYQVLHAGAGGLQRVRTGLGIRPRSWLSLGATIDLIFGITEETRRTTFVSEDLFETNVATSTRMHGLTATGGALMTLENFLATSDDFSVGASVTLPTSLSANRALTLGESLDRDTLGTQMQGNIYLPPSIRGGVAYSLQNRWSATVDVLYEPWTRFKSDLPLAGYAPGGRNNMHDRFRYSGGIEFLPAGTSQLDSYLARSAYRLGFYVDQMYVTPTSAANVRTRAIMGGVSFPALLSGTRLDLTFQAGTRGSSKHNLVRDRFLALSITVNIGERWFVKRKLG